VTLLIRTSIFYSSEIGSVAINSDILVYACIFKYLPRTQDQGETSSFVAVFCHPLVGISSNLRLRCNMWTEKNCLHF